jgi:hypothetical protein
MSKAQDIPKSRNAGDKREECRDAPSDSSQKLSIANIVDYKGCEEKTEGEESERNHSESNPLEPGQPFAILPPSDIETVGFAMTLADWI